MRKAALALFAATLAFAPAAPCKDTDKNTVEKSADAVGKGVKTAGVKSGKVAKKGWKKAAKGGEKAADATVDGAEVVGKETVKGAKKVGDLFDGDKPRTKK